MTINIRKVALASIATVVASGMSVGVASADRGQSG